MKYSRTKGIVTVFAAVAVASACSDATGSSAGMGSVAVTMQQVSAPVLQTADAFLSPAGAMGKVDKAKVDSLFVWITRVGFLPQDSTDADSTDADSTAADSTDDGNDDDYYPWIWLDLDSVVRIDLMALPAETDSAVVIAEGAVPAGDYRKLRMIVADANVYFNEMVTVGNADFDMDVEHRVDVPSGAQSGLKTDVSFTVEADTVTAQPLGVNVLFDPNLTFNNVIATGSGRVKLTPVLKSR
jgi:hypothetical protein